MTALMIANTQIRCDADGRYCLNDLHQASGGEGRHRPGRWLDSEKTRELIAEIEKFPETTAGIPAVLTAEGFGGGTYAVKELVYAYAMWISAAFHLHVIRAYDALVQQRAGQAPALLALPQHRADQMVSAGRIFSAAFRTARQARMPFPKAVLAATNCAQRHTGIDWREECGLDIPVTAPELEDPFHQRVAEILALHSSFEMEDLIAEHNLGGRRDISLMKRLGTIARALGWRPHRHQAPDRRCYTQWRRVVE